MQALMDKYGVFGNPVQHSKSPSIHRCFAEQTHQHMTYESLLGDLQQFEQQVRDFFATGGKGLNITVPFKERAFVLCDVLSQRAKKAGAVNTLMLGKNGDIFGDNTDGVGMIRDICENHDRLLAGKRILVLGAGGAVRGILEPLLHERPSEVVIANRTLAKAEGLAADVANGQVRCIASDFSVLNGTFDVIINGTSASLSGDLPPIPNQVVTSTTWGYDMMYGQQPTVFLRWLTSLGGQGVDGLGMLVEQAAEAFYLWRMQRPQTAPVIRQIRLDLAQS